MGGVEGLEVGSPAGERSRVIQVRASRLLEEAVAGGVEDRAGQVGRIKGVWLRCGGKRGWGLCQSLSHFAFEVYELLLAFVL